MKAYQYILLDWDGNLAKTLDVWLAASHQGLKKRGFYLSDEEIGASFGAFPEHYHAIGVKDPDILLEEVCTTAAQNMSRVELYPDALDILNHLKSLGKRLALVTTSRRDTVSKVLDRLKLHPLFDAIIASEDVTHHKPHPEPLEKALKALGGNPQSAVMIGDSDKDVLSANHAGIDSIIFMPQEHKKFYNFDKIMAHHPTYTVQNFQEIMKIIT